MTNFQLFAVEDAGPRALPIPEGATQFTDLYRDLPLGVYTALRTFDHNKFLYLNRHLARTERSMALLGWNYQLDRSRLLRALHAVVTTAEWPEMRVRIDVLAGPAEALGAGRELIALQPFTPPPSELYASGVIVDFAAGLARERPLAKTADFAARRPMTAGLGQLEKTTDDGPQTTTSESPVDASPLAVVGRQESPRPSSAVTPYEYLLLNPDRHILEGTGTNFWAVREGVVYTAGEGVLEGITREIILNLILELDIPLRMEAVAADDIATLDEAALSGSSRAFLPVVGIAGQAVGDGRPGPISRRILEAYNAFVEANIRTAI